MPGAKYTSVSIPVPLHEKVKGLIAGTGFKSVGDYVTFVLRELVAETGKDGTGRAFSRKNKEALKEKLRKLGYID